MTSPILESFSVWFVDRHVVAIMGHKMPPRDPNDDDDEDEKDEEDEEQDDEPAVIREPDEDAWLGASRQLIEHLARPRVRRGGVTGGTEHEAWFREDTEEIDFFATRSTTFYLVANRPT